MATTASHPSELAHGEASTQMAEQWDADLAADARFGKILLQLLLVLLIIMVLISPLTMMIVSLYHLWG